MSALTPEQWATAGEFAFRSVMERMGLTPSDAEIADARDSAVWIATGKHIPPAEPAQQEKTMNGPYAVMQEASMGVAGSANPRPPSPVSDALTGMDDVIGRLGAVAVKLHDGLHDALRPEPPEASSTKDASREQMASPLAERIQNQRESIERVVALIDGMNGRLTL